MEQLITQVKYLDKGEYSRKGSVLCTLVDEKKHIWHCEVEKMSLTEVAKFIVGFFDSTSVTATELTFSIFKRNVSVYNSSSVHDYKHYLEQICHGIVIE